MIKNIAVAWFLITSNVYTITHDMGGTMLEYMAAARELSKNNTLIRIDGVCASSCLIFIHSDFNTQYCATKGARLGYHAPYFFNNSTNEIEMGEQWKAKAEYLNRWFIQGLPNKMQDILKDNSPLGL